MRVKWGSEHMPSGPTVQSGQAGLLWSSNLYIKTTGQWLLSGHPYSPAALQPSVLTGLVVAPGGTLWMSRHRPWEPESRTSVKRPTRMRGRGYRAPQEVPSVPAQPLSQASGRTGLVYGTNPPRLCVRVQGPGLPADRMSLYLYWDE